MHKNSFFYIFLIIFIPLLMIFSLYNNTDNIKLKDKSNIEKKKDNEENNNFNENENIEVELISKKINQDNEKDINNTVISNSYLETFNVYFNCNNGSESLESKKVIYKKEYGILPTPVKVGYTFDGWYTEGNKKVDSTSIVNVKSDHTLYAHYTINNYLISYDYNYLKDNLYRKVYEKSSWNLEKLNILTDDEIFNNENVLKFTFCTEDSILKYNEEIILDKDKTYTFSVFIKTSEEMNLLIGFENDLMKIKTNSSWKRFTKTFKANSDKYTDFIFKLDDNLIWNNNDTIEIYGLMISEGNLNLKEETKEYGQELGKLDNPIRDGYTFEGWYTDFTFKEKIESNEIVDASNKIYYARWIPKMYTLTINPNKGTYENNSFTQKFFQGYKTIKNIEKPKASYKITYDLNNTGALNTKNEDIINRDFKGWIDENNESFMSNAYIFDKNLSLTANYEETVDVALDSISKVNYTCFWNTNSDGSGKKYSSGGNISVSGDISLYTICEKNIKFLRPLTTGCITSEYGYRIHPIYGYEKFHSGIDMSGTDRNVYSILDGVVAKTGYNSSMGNYIIIHHQLNGQNYTSAYYHLELKYVYEGQIVSENTIIGKMGSTGASTGIHLHLTMYKGHLYKESSTMVNPRDYLNFPTILYNSWYDREV